MYIVTILTYDELDSLIGQKRVSLDNGRLMFGQDEEVINKYFRDRIGHDGYVIGIGGRLNNVTSDIMKSLDRTLTKEEKVLLEVEVDNESCIRYEASGIGTAADALLYGLSDSAVYDQMDEARKEFGSPEGIEFICVPYIRNNGKIRITSFYDEELTLNVEGITFVKARK